jgi:glycosyltransferase involved in cell wall biosynthesis
MAALGLDVVFQPLLPVGQGPPPPSETRADDSIRKLGIDVLPDLATPAPPRTEGRRGLVRECVAATPHLFNPAYLLRDEVAARVDASAADVVLHVYSPGALAACSAVDRPVFAYYGNPDHKALRARLRHPQLFDIPHTTTRNRARIALYRLANRNRRRVHVRLMKTCRWSANSGATDAQFYARHGHANAFYLQNMWGLDGADAAAGVPGDGEAKIVGNLGGLDATGNTFGLWYLGTEVLPALDARLGERYEVHLYGPRRPTAAVAAAIDHPRVRVRGFVDDIDRELRSAKVFLMVNNTNPDFIVGHTRILHAWSLGLCLVAHENMARAMPEIVHGENALLGRSGEELADHVLRVLRDEELRRALGEAGRRTYEREFTPPTVVRRIVNRIEGDLAGEERGGRA